MEQQIKRAVLIALPLLAALFFAAFFYYKHISEINRYDFVLQGSHGEVKLKDFRGKKTVVYFGYGLCPDVCPTTLVAIAEALKKLSPKELDGVETLFISLDPARDTPAQLEVFAHYFHPSIIGATASEAYIKELAARYGVAYKKEMQPSSAIGYSIGHSADTYLIGRDGKLEATLQFGAIPDEFVAAIRK